MFSRLLQITDPGPKLGSAAHNRNDSRKLLNLSDSSMKTEKIIRSLQAEAKFYSYIITVSLLVPWSVLLGFHKSPQILGCRGWNRFSHCIAQTSPLTPKEQKAHKVKD